MSVTPIFRVLQILLIFPPNANPNDHEESFSPQTAGTYASIFAGGPPVVRSSFTSPFKRSLIGQITRALHARNLIRLEMVLVAIIFKPSAVQDLSISPVALIGNGCLAAFISE
jgi:hypothetical protein